MISTKTKRCVEQVLDLRPEENIKKKPSSGRKKISGVIEVFLGAIVLMGDIN